MDCKSVCFRVTSQRSPGSENCIKFGKFLLFGTNRQVLPLSNYRIECTQGSQGQSSPRSGSFERSSFQYPLDVLIRFDHPVTVSCYGFVTSADHPEHDPVSWELIATTTTSDLVLLDSRSGFPVPLERSRGIGFPVTNPRPLNSPSPSPSPVPTGPASSPQLSTIPPPKPSPASTPKLSPRPTTPTPEDTPRTNKSPRPTVPSELPSDASEAWRLIKEEWEKIKAEKSQLKLERIQLETQKTTDPIQIANRVLLIDRQGARLETLPNFLSTYHPNSDSQMYTKSRMSRRQELRANIASVRSAFVFDKASTYIPDKAAPGRKAAKELLERLRSEFQRDPSFDGINNASFCAQLSTVCEAAARIIADDPVLLKLKSPIYVLGDIHGNFHDLEFFLSRLLAFSHFEFTANSFLLLGDYVDRGTASVAVAAALLALKVIGPQSLFLLRGNHETEDQNGNVSQYGMGSFKAECWRRFGQQQGEWIWSLFNQAFVQLPLAAMVDNKVFCAHGGIPRYSGGDDRRLEILSRRDFPRFRTVMPNPSDDPYISQARQIARDLMWADPAETENGLDQYGFGQNPDRGISMVRFGDRAIEDFLRKTGCEVILRAHEMKQEGLRLSKNAKVVTVFTSSAYCGDNNGAAAIFIANGKLRFICVMAEVTNPQQFQTASSLQYALKLAPPAIR